VGKYLDRGILKWAPFNSVNDTQEDADKLNFHRLSIAKPQLSEDSLAELDTITKLAFESKSVVNIDFYQAGYLNQICGIIKKIDEIDHNLILLSSETININDILAIKILDNTRPN
jgi:hypothetical protein